MSERVVISVDPGVAVLGSRVQDVFGHVLDLFELLSHSGAVGGSEEVAWRLVSVSMNSPLMVVAEAVATSPVPAAKFARVARTQKRDFAKNLTELKQGRVPDAWRGSGEVKRVRRAFSPASPSTTRFEIPSDKAGAPAEVVVMAPVDMPVVELALAKAEVEASPKPKDQIGSIEGQLLEVGTFYNHPAIKLRERKTGAEVWCTITEEHRKQVAAQASFEDVWASSRVLIEGRLSYERSGALARVTADSVHVITPVQISPDAIADPNFTQGMSGSEYLDRFREGTLG